jgi:hypothetical protein
MRMQRIVNSLLVWLSRLYRPEDDEHALLRAEAEARLERLGPTANRVTKRSSLPDTHVRKQP